MTSPRWSQLNRDIIACEQCSRLRDHCQSVADTKRKAYKDDTYWGRPVPNFGSDRSDLLVVGLAPGAHGANRTGRMFTGDRSGDWLYRALHRFGFANQADAVSAGDGLKLKHCAITNVCRCAPPDNKPTQTEVTNCRPYFERTVLLCQPTVTVALGGLAWRQTSRQLVKLEWLRPVRRLPKFAHAAIVELTNRRWLLGSYHPSQQNTFTGRLTESMLDDVFRLARKFVDGGRPD